MPPQSLNLFDPPPLNTGVLILGFDGWMDGGEVSTGTTDWLADALDARIVGEIDPGNFYIYNFPGSMEVAALFRPHGKIEDGLITEFDLPRNTFFADPSMNLAIFRGKEPNFGWAEFADAIFTTCRRMSIQRIYFVGSVAGLSPHSREPRIFCSVSDAKMKPEMESYGLNFSDYEGPVSFVTYLMTLAPSHGLEMATVVAEIPAYVHSHNPKSIEAVLRKLSAIAGLSLDLDPLRSASDEWEKKVNEVVAEKNELGDYIHKLEEDYDNEVFNTQMSDLKDWLEDKGLQVD